MQQAAGAPGRLRFGVFEADLRTGELKKRGARIRLQEQPFQVLAMLLARPGELVTREELRGRLWTADTFVDFDHGLNKAINKIREALGDSAESPRFVETVPRRGYRFVADVAVVDFESAPRDASTPSAAGDPLAAEDREPSKVAEQSAAARGLGWQRTLTITSGGLALASVILIGWLVHSREPPPTIRSVAVLPLENLSGDASQEYFADGMTDQLIATLGQISALRVISRTSVMRYKGVLKPLPQIARELNVDAVIEGSIMRAGGRVRITAQLIEAAVDKHLWAQSYDGDLRDTLALQSRVARAIAEEIRVNIQPKEQAALRNVKSVNPDAYEAYLKGRYFWNKRTVDGLNRAKEYFDDAVAKAPDYAQAYSGLADTYALLGDWQYGRMPAKEALPAAKAAAIRALELDDSLGEAHTSLGFVLSGFDWNWAAAEKEFRQAIDLNPGYATAHHWYAWHLSLMGRNGESIAEMRKARSLDPLSLIINADLAEVLLLGHFYDESAQQSRKTIEMDSDFALAHNQLAEAYLQKHMGEDAIAEFRKAVQLSEGSPMCTANLARAYASSGRNADAQQLMIALQQRSNPAYSNAAEIAMIYGALGENAQAMAWLERGYDERFNPGVLLRPGFDSLRADPRFRDLVHRVGLTQ
ncbi:MAG TPA: winged helix-turn-helix domain-containing protein [Vicinamibacterales bacterium]|jgi:TolB-like protein/DNA-binding winged helix-turn-helix (wHTH) protein/Tfp pilus assembly protein PilF|nr:winged helix-turn-helix domain-containing protein [Vicinamibacterales bacterium]